MSTLGHVRSTLSPVRLDAEDQLTYLSLCGLEAWRLFRQGMNRSLLVEMFASHYGMRYVAGIGEVVRNCIGTARFPDMAALAAFIWGQVEPFDESVAEDFAAQPYLFSVVDDRLATWLSHDPAQKNIRLIWVDKVVTFMAEDLDHHKHEATAAYRATMTRLWFAMCDAAAGVTATRDQVTA